MFGYRPRVHVKYDTGMGRLGDREPFGVVRLADAAAGDDRIELAGRLDPLRHRRRGRRRLPSRAARPLPRGGGAAAGAPSRASPSMPPTAPPRCAAPSSTSRWSAAGSRSTGSTRSGATPPPQGLEPALTLHTYVADVKRIHAGESVGYGRSWRAPADTWVAVLPVGYGDGFRRGLSNACDVLIGGGRRPLVGTISMDNVTVDLGPEPRSSPASRRSCSAARATRRSAPRSSPSASGRSTTRSPAG